MTQIKWAIHNLLTGCAEAASVLYVRRRWRRLAEDLDMTLTSTTTPPVPATTSDYGQSSESAYERLAGRVEIWTESGSSEHAWESTR